MEYKEALDYINDKSKFGSSGGLGSISKLLDLLDNPQDRLKCIHIAGTNGKGSTASYLSNALIEAGYKVGLFTSPYIERFNERIQINSKNIADEEIGRITELIREKANLMVEEGYDHPTTFELVTALGFVYFFEKEVDYLILEVGIGGRTDSTNVIKNSLASVITTIDYDHIDTLGSSLAEIAYQKAGIVKDKGLVISYPQKDEAMKVIEHIVALKGAELYISPIDQLGIKSMTSKASSFDFRYGEYEIKDVEIRMLGKHQVYNACLALTILLILRDRGLIHISKEQILRGLKKTKWPGRLEILGEKPMFLIDGAHNLQGINQLKKTLKLFNYKRLILAMGILKDKDRDKMIASLVPMGDILIATEVSMPRKVEASDLARDFRKYKDQVYIEKDIKKAILRSMALAEEGDLIVFAGSLYLIGEVRSLYKSLYRS